MVKQIRELTERERQILKLLADGNSNAEAAEKLGISRRTIEAHRARLMLKLDINDLANLVKYAIKNNITTL